MLKKTHKITAVLMALGTFSLYFSQAQAENFDWNSNLVNSYLQKWDPNIIPGVTDPFTSNVTVTEVQPTKVTYFVRGYTPASGIGAIGTWLMKASEVRGLTPEQMKDKFALQYAPTKIEYVKIPAERKYAYWKGEAGAINDPAHPWGNGGGEQIKIINKHTSSADPADPARFADYAFPNATTNFFNGQDPGSLIFNYGNNITVSKYGNIGRVAHYLDKNLVVTNPSNDSDNSDLDVLYAVLDSLNLHNTTAFTNALNTLFNPELYDAISVAGFRNNLVFGSALFDRGRDLRLSFGQQLPLPTTKMPQKKYDIWAHGVGEYVDQSGDTDRTGFQYHTYGMVAGVDYKVRQNLILGIGAAFLKNNLDWNNARGDAAIKNAKLGLYASYFTPDVFLDSALMSGINWTSAKRHVDNISGIAYSSLTPTLQVNDPDLATGTRNATSDQAGRDLALQVKGGVNYHLCNWNVTPLALFGYFYNKQNSFDENGADNANLHVSGLNSQIIRAEVGMSLDRNFKTERGTEVVPSAELDWAHDFPLGKNQIDYNIKDVATSSSVEGFHQETNSMLANVGLTVHFLNGMFIYGKYGAEFTHGFTGQTANLGLGYRFN